MFDNFTYFNWLVIAGISGGFLGTLLSWLTNFVYKMFAQENRDRRYLIEGVIISIAMGLVAGGLVFGFSLFDTVSFEDDSIKYTFISLFLSCFFSGSIDTLLELLKQASSILNSNKID